jgi:hypothetical protein
MVAKTLDYYIQNFLRLVLYYLCEFLGTVFVMRVLLSSYVYLLYLMFICCKCILCVFVVSHVYLLYLMCICCTSCVFVVILICICYTVCIAALNFDAGLLARSQYPEGLAAGHFVFLVSLCLQANAEMAPKFPSYY